jgi:pimeloyl-ACP methyl ester carboxylesterase
VSDIAAAVAFLRAAGHARIALVGWSMGGSVVLRYAGLGGDADAVVSISSPGHWWERGTAPMRLVHWAAETRAGRFITRLATGTRLRNFEWQQLPESPIEVVAAIAPRPLLIVHGDADRYFPLRHGEALAVAAPDCVFWAEAGMGHAESATTPALVQRVDAWVRQALTVTALRP